MIDITAELEGVRTEQWGSKLREYLADGMEKLANQAAESEIITTIRGEVTELKTKAEEAYNRLLLQKQMPLLQTRKWKI